MPQLVTDTLLVVESFKHEGTEYRPGDRVPTRHRAIRRIAAASPQFFAMEYGSEPLDLEWLASVEAEAEGRYEEAKRRRDAQKGQRERAIRAELEAQEQPQHDLEKRYRQRQEEQAKRAQQVREEREREELESQASLSSGFNF